jgi:1-acyl-sn-glycerol-3-phosphate acyltransferase
MFAPHATEILALFVLGGILGILVGFVIATFRRWPFTIPRALLHVLNQVMARIIWRTQISGPLPVAPGEGAVIICNHRSSIDPAILQLAADRVVHWMVAQEYCQRGVIGAAMRSCKVIATRRSGIDTRATKTAIRYAQQGHMVGMFPEGRINLTEDLLRPGRPGAALVALKARVPIVPCYIDGSPYNGTAAGPLMMPAHVRVVVGDKMDISAYYDRDGEREVLEEITLRGMKEIARLAGHDDFQPKLAGRRWSPAAEERQDDAT